MTIALSMTWRAKHHVWPLDAPTMRIGRGSGNAIQIRDHSISREHAEILIRAGRPLIRDLHSHNGTWLNGARVNRPAELHPGDRIQMGRICLEVAERPAADALPIDDSTTVTAVVEFPSAYLVGNGPRERDDSSGFIRKLETFGRILVKQKSHQTVYDTLVCAVESALPTTRVLLLLEPEPNRGLEIAASSPRIPCFPDSPIVPLDTLRGVLGRAAAMLWPDVEAGAKDRAPRTDGAHVPTAMAVPVLSEGRPLGLLYAEHAGLEGGYRREHLGFLALFANIAGIRVATGRISRVEHDIAHIEHELAMASRIQQRLLPSRDLRIAGYDIHALLEPCEAVGGDFYDVRTDTRGYVWIMLGDVAGKGICGAILMSMLVSSARVLYDECQGPAALAQRLTGVLRGESDCGRFATAFIGRLDPDRGTLHYANAGHPAPLVLAGNRLRRLRSTGVPLGVESEIDYREAAVAVPPGALMTLFSDGLPEAMRERGRFFGGRRLASAVRSAARSESLEAAGRSLIRNVDEFLGGRPRTDDIALLLVRRSTIDRR